MQSWAAAMLAILGLFQIAGAPQNNDNQPKSGQPDADAGAARQTDFAPQVRQLVRRLDASELAVREQAYADLLKLGPAVLAYLPTNSENAPAAIQDAVRRLRREFDRQAANDAMKASSITLQTKYSALGDVAAAFEKQTGNKLIVEAAPETRVDVDLQAAPFWKALDRIADDARLSVYSFAQDGLRLRPALEGARPRSDSAFYQGPLRFKATSLRLERDLRAAGPASIHIGMEIAWEPRLRPISLRQPLSALQAQDDQGKAIVVMGEGERSALPHQGSSAVEFELPFQAPPREVRVISKLAGTMQILVPGKLETFEFSGLADVKKAEQQRHNAVVTLDAVRKVNEIWEVRIRVKYLEAFGALDSHLVSWVLNNEAYLINKAGQRLENAGFETTQRSDDEIGVAYFFDNIDDLTTVRFVYKTPSTIYNMPVKYELQGLELP